MSSSWLGFENEDLRSLSTLTLTAGTLVANQTDVGETGPRAVTAGKSNRELKHRRLRGDGDVYSRGKPGVEAAVDTIESRRLSKRSFHDGNVFETFIKTLKKLPKMPSKKSLLLQFFGKEKNRDTEFLVWEEIN